MDPQSQENLDVFMCKNCPHWIAVPEGEEPLGWHVMEGPGLISIGPGNLCKKCNNRKNRRKK